MQPFLVEELCIRELNCGPEETKLGYYELNGSRVDQKLGLWSPVPVFGPRNFQFGPFGNLHKGSKGAGKY